MNYRHAFHAGNFADVVKHIVLTRILIYLHEKPSAFRVIDSHAGAGLYDLTGEDARRGGEWRDGIGRVRQAQFSAEVADLLRPYLDTVAAFNATTELTTYPGSPLIARALLRPQDRLVACELEASARRRLIDNLRRDRQARVVDLDGWMALRAFLPPQERRGVVLIDPPFEQPDEFERMAETFAAAFTKWPTGIFMLWYPVKDMAATRALARAVTEQVGAAGARDRCLRIELSRPAGGAGDTALATTGLLVVNPPWTLENQLKTIMPELAAALGGAPAGRFSLDHPA